MAVLKIYNKEKELILVSQEFTGDKGWGLLTDLLPNTTYDEGTYFVSWEDKNYETELIPVPRFTTESNTNKELVFYFKDALIVKPMTAYDIAVKNGFTGTEQEWVESIKGEPGDKGDDGVIRFENLTEEQQKILKGEPGKDLVFSELTNQEKEYLRSNITDQAVTDYVIPDSGITTPKIKNKAITPEKTSFIKTSDNLLDKNDVTVGKNLNTNNGELINSGVANVFNKWLEVNPGETFTSKGLYARAYYDKDRNFISGTTGNGTFTIPENTKFVRFSTTSLDSTQLNSGSELKPYDEYFDPYLDEDIAIKGLPKDSIGSEQIKSNAVTFDKVNFINRSNNLLNKEKFKTGYAITASSSGEPVANSTQNLSDFVLIEPNTVYTSDTGSSRVAFYDSNKKYVSQYSASTGTGMTFTTPPNAKYLRINIYKTAIDKAMLNEGSELLPYEDWHEPYLEGVTAESSIDSEKITEEIIKKLEEESLKDRKTFTFDTSLNLNYTPEKVTGCSDNDPLPMGQIQYTDMYDMYDELCNKYPNYVSRKVEGKDILEDEIISYTFKPEEQSFTNNSVEIEKTYKRFKFFIVSSTHGNERTSIWVLYNLMKLICEKWQTDESLEFLRWNVEFVICPVISPGGYRHFTRINANGVDLNRNFDADWENGSADKSNTTYRGDTPMSEPESIVCDNILKREEPNFVIDFHNYHSQGEPTSFNWIIGYNDKVNDIADLVLSKMARKWKKQYPDLPQDVTGFGSGSPGIKVGSLTNYAQQKYDIPSSLFEICWKMDAKTDSIKRDSFISTIGVDSFSNFLLQIANNANDL